MALHQKWPKAYQLDDLYFQLVTFFRGVEEGRRRHLLVGVENNYPQMKLWRPFTQQLL
jgi:hypothetical protein